MSKILIVEDDKDIAELERDYLEASGFDTAIAPDGRRGLSLACGGGFDLVILDLMLPGEDGLSVCRSIRERSGVPIIMVTARSEDIDVIRGLGTGANDYVTKPFSPSVLVARVKACLASTERAIGAAVATANANEPQADDIVFGDVCICPASHAVRVADSEVALTNREYELLLFLAQRPDTVFSRQAIYQRVWGEDAVGDGSTVTVHVNRLREKLERDPANPTLIQTVRGAGYILHSNANA
ncbi:DNA-binding response regulator, OmpR family, contains REC and winged-helix (wHTH) domain [Olsenella sp. KH3B4]|uniref:response regulator transcription factor n=1 Tax=Olsenella sp. KH3B4 TaxID=1855394 RepID=UPI0008BA35E3|nr:response regulator transcription factor [Olsenella sp. KH3B4]SET18620.1 DNA-binding response regulator, OmpR family, contains REC and winged-helix (wHTH) domain [Olsenella sp. KH3B4]